MLNFQKNFSMVKFQKKIYVLAYARIYNMYGHRRNGSSD